MHGLRHTRKAALDKLAVDEHSDANAFKEILKITKDNPANPVKARNVTYLAGNVTCFCKKHEETKCWICKKHFVSKKDLVDEIEDDVTASSDATHTSRPYVGIGTC